jgi:uracil-DNA glycosylase family 4
MKFSLLQQKVNDVEQQIFNCSKCPELFELRQNKVHNCPVLGFNVVHYANARVCSICEAPGVYKPHKGEQLIDKLEDFHKIYDDRIQNVSLIGSRLFEIYSKANLTWQDIQHFNVVCCSPPNYRKPQVDEVVSCLPFLLMRINLVQRMKVIITFGTVAKNAVKRFKLNVPIVYSHHPSYIYSYMPESERQDYINRVANSIKKCLT